MRLWSLHPHYLDAKGLVALWREGFLVQKVLAGLTKGYRHHPQLTRFYCQADAQGAIAEGVSRITCQAFNFCSYRIDALAGLVDGRRW